MAAWIPWHERGLGAHTRRRRWVNRALAIVATPLMLFYLVMPIGAALWSTHKYRTPIGTFSIPHQDAGSVPATDYSSPAGTSPHTTAPQS